MNFEDTIERRATQQDLAYGGHLVHVDGSHTFVYFGDQDDFEASNPREYDGNVVNLVVTREHYVDLDEADDDLDEMRQVCDFLGERWARTTTNMFPRTKGWEFHRYEDEEREECHLVIPLPAPMYSGGNIWLDLDDKHHAFAALAYLRGLDAEECMAAYVAEHRPDIAHYEHKWTVTGSSQSDWSEGWAYVTWEDLHEQQIDLDTNFPEDIYKGEFEVYSLWFSGDVYYGVHVAPGPNEFVIGDEGGYYLDTHECTEDVVGGFLGYPTFKELAGEFTGSPVA